MDLGSFVTGQFGGWILVFARLGSALMFMPGFGEAYLPVRSRLAAAVTATIALYPATPVPPVAPDQLALLARLMLNEALVGLWIGSTARIILSALHFAGYQAGYAAGLGNAFAPGAAGAEGATSVAQFLLVATTALIFLTDTHHVIIRALLSSYAIFPFGSMILGDFASQMAKAASGSFYIGLTIAAPFFVMGLLLNLGLGLANRMMASLAVFFVAGSGLVAAGIFVLAVAAPSMLRGWLTAFTSWLNGGFTF